MNPAEPVTRIFTRADHPSRRVPDVDRPACRRNVQRPILAVRGADDQEVGPLEDLVQREGARRPDVEVGAEDLAPARTRGSSGACTRAIRAGRRCRP